MDLPIMYVHHPKRPLPETEAYHRLIDHNKHLLLQIKMTVILFIGVVVIIVCIIYIFTQCRTKLVRPLFRQTQHRKAQEKADTRRLFGSTDTLDDLLPPCEKNSLPLKIRKDAEFYVWFSRLSSSPNKQRNHLKSLMILNMKAEWDMCVNIFSQNTFCCLFPFISLYAASAVYFALKLILNKNTLHLLVYFNSHHQTTRELFK